MSQQVAAAIASPVVSAPSAYVAAPQAQPKNSNTIVLAIILIAIVVFCIFLFTKLNTVNKEVKELKTDRDSLVKSMKLLEAIGEHCGIRQNEQGEVEQLTDETEEAEEDGEEEDCEEAGMCRLDGKCDEEECNEACEKRPQRRRTEEFGRNSRIFDPTINPAMFGPLFGGLAGMGISPTDASVTIVRASATPVVEEAPAATAPDPPKESSTEKVD